MMMMVGGLKDFNIHERIIKTPQPQRNLTRKSLLLSSPFLKNILRRIPLRKIILKRILQRESPKTSPRVRRLSLMLI